VADEPPALDTVTAQPLATWQTNGVVYAVETVGNVVYAGGNFSTVRPPGAAAGSQEVARKNIAAFNATTGALLPFSHTFKSPDLPIPAGGYDKTCSPGSTAGTYTCDTVYEIRVSRDGSKIYVGGDFTQVDGLARGNLAAFSTADNALLPWRVTGIAGRVRSLAVGTDTVYFGGSFTQAGGQPRSRLAAADASTGALRAWAPTADKQVITMALSTDDSRVILGGQFDTINGAPIHGIAAVGSTGVGASTRWDSQPVPPTSYITDLSVSGDTVFASANGEGGGVFDGRLAADTHTGQLVWQDVCLGATWAIEVAGPLVYSGSHAHDCSRTSGGFPESWNVPPPATPRYYRLLAQTKDGSYAPHIQHWFPTTNGGIVGKLGPRDLTWTGQQLWVAGEFTTVNGAPQQGLTRFGPSPTYPRIAPVRPDAPTASSARPGEVRLSIRATEDLDDELLTYTILRGPSTGSMTAIGTVKARSKPWMRPSIRFTDTGLNPGQTYFYQVTAADSTGRISPRSFASSVTVATTVDPYTNAVLNSDPSMYWRLSDPAGSTSVKAVVGSGGTATSDVAFGVQGALQVDPNNTAVRTSGASTSTIGSNDAEAGLDVFSAEAWFRTSSTSGGKIFGFGNSQLGRSGNYDRHAYMQSDGRITFGVYNGNVSTITSNRAYNDGKWHSLVVTLGADGMRLFVDGASVASRSDVRQGQPYMGYWRLGGDNLNGWPSVGSADFAGDIDEFAVYDRVLTADEVLAHRTAGSADSEAPSTPVVTSAQAGGRTVVLQWNESTDDIAVARYEVHRVTGSTGTTSTSTRVGTTTGLTYSATNTPVGTSYWRIVAVDGAGNMSAPSAAAAVTVSGAEPYAEAVLSDSPELYWRLSDAAGSTSASAVVGPRGNVESGASFGVSGPLGSDTAVRTDGSVNGLIVSTGQIDGPQTFTVEGWFRTTTTRGGKIIGFGRASSGTSGSYDRHIYMRDDGTLVLGVYPGGIATVTSTQAYNDGAWHHVAGSLGSAGLILSVDGQTIGTDPAVTRAEDYPGYWRLGGDNTWGGASSNFFAGDIDEFAVYPRQLTATQIARHASLASGGGADVTAPSAPSQVSTAVSGNTVNVSWQASSDDTAVTGYQVHRGNTATFAPTASTLVKEATGTTAQETSVPVGNWYYRVVAMDAAGNASNPSNSASATVAPAPDTTAPTAPSGLQASVSGSNVGLSWNAATDNVAVTKYVVHRSATADFTPATGTVIGEATTLSYTDAGRPAGTTWYYRVVAMDAAGNTSAASAAATATIASATPVQTVLAPSADAWIDASAPDRNYGNAWALTTDGSPVNEAWLRFTLPAAPAGKTLTRAVLRVRTSTQTWSGSVGSVPIYSGSNSWTEAGLTYGSRQRDLTVNPTALGSVPAGQSSDSAYEVDLAANQVAGMLSGDASFVMSMTNSDGAQFVSREGAAAARPQLVLTFS
jgi:hypothetical protein